jgi:hypothetical protein
VGGDHKKNPHPLSLSLSNTHTHFSLFIPVKFQPPFILLFKTLKLKKTVEMIITMSNFAGKWNGETKFPSDVIAFFNTA